MHLMDDTLNFRNTMNLIQIINSILKLFCRVYGYCNIHIGIQVGNTGINIHDIDITSTKYRHGS